MAMFIKKNNQLVNVGTTNVVGITPTGNQDITTLNEYDISNKATARVSATERDKIIASNIKKDVTILGVTGNYEGATTHPFIICKSTWTTSSVTVTLGSWSHTFNLPSYYAGFNTITYEDLFAQGWDGSYEFSCSITVLSSAASNNSKIDFLGFMSSAGPSANVYYSTVSSNTLTVNMSTGADPIGSDHYSCCALITCGLINFSFDD